MAKITENIDLTLNSYYAGDEDPSLIPYEWRIKTRNQSFELHWINELTGQINISNLTLGHPMFSEPEIDYTYQYYKFFGEWGCIEDDLCGWINDGKHCDRCGLDINPLNSHYGLCDKCNETYLLKDAMFEKYV